MFLVSRVESDAEESLVKDVALSSGLVSPADTTAKSLGALAGNGTGIPEHVSVYVAHTALPGVPRCFADRDRRKVLVPERGTDFCSERSYAWGHTAMLITYSVTRPAAPLVYFVFRELDAHDSPMINSVAVSVESLLEDGLHLYRWPRPCFSSLASRVRRTRTYSVASCRTPRLGYCGVVLP